MRKKRLQHILSTLIFVVLALSLIAGECMASVTLQVLNPQGEIPAVEEAATSPRLDTLDGKTIAMISNGKINFNVVLKAVEEDIKEKYPTANFVHMRTGNGYNLTEEQLNEIKGYDAYVHGIGD